MFLLIAWKLPCWGSEADNFNTSHVSINQAHEERRNTVLWISIHLMFLLIAENAEEPEEDDDHFNTSHVSINQMGLIQTVKRWLFQYISCFY